MLETYRVSAVWFALAVMLGLACNYDRCPAELVAGNVDRQPVPLEPRMRVTPPADIVPCILVDVIDGDPQPLYQIAAEQLGSMSAGSSWVSDMLQRPCSQITKTACASLRTELCADRSRRNHMERFSITFVSAPLRKYVI